MQCLSHQNPKLSEPPLGPGRRGCRGWHGWELPWSLPTGNACPWMWCTDTDAVMWGSLDLSSHEPITTLCPAPCWS